MRKTTENIRHNNHSFTQQLPNTKQVCQHSVQCETWYLIKILWETRYYTEFWWETPCKVAT